MRYFSFFLHYYEHRLNRRIHSFLRSDGGNRYDPERFLDMKLACMETLLEKLPDYDLQKNTAYTTYLYEFINDALLTCCMREEAWSLSSLDAYKKTRTAAWLYHNSENMKQAVERFAQEKECTLESAAWYLQTAQAIRSRQPLYVTGRDEDGEETGEDVTKDDSWDIRLKPLDSCMAHAMFKPQRVGRYLLFSHRFPQRRIVNHHIWPPLQFLLWLILSLNKSIGNQGMTEKSRNLVFISLKGTHKRVCFVTNI